MAKRYWLFKSEPEVFSFLDLERAKDQTTSWEGVRNYQARNMLRDDVQAGDEIFFYHSRTEPMHVAGLARVVRAAYPDPFQFDPSSRYHDPDSTREEPRWYTVDIRYERPLARPVTLEEMREEPKLSDMVLLRKGSRLSIQPVTPDEWKAVIELSKRPAEPPAAKSSKRAATKTAQEGANLRKQAAAKAAQRSPDKKGAAKSSMTRSAGARKSK